MDYARFVSNPNRLISYLTQGGSIVEVRGYVYLNTNGKNIPITNGQRI